MSENSTYIDVRAWWSDSAEAREALGNARALLLAQEQDGDYMDASAILGDSGYLRAMWEGAVGWPREYGRLAVLTGITATRATVASNDHDTFWALLTEDEHARLATIDIAHDVGDRVHLSACIVHTDPGSVIG